MHGGALDAAEPVGDLVGGRKHCAGAGERERPGELTQVERVRERGLRGARDKWRAHERVRHLSISSPGCMRPSIR